MGRTKTTTHLGTGNLMMERTTTLPTLGGVNLTVQVPQGPPPDGQRKLQEFLLDINGLKLYVAATTPEQRQRDGSKAFPGAIEYIERTALVMMRKAGLFKLPISGDNLTARLDRYKIVNWNADQATQLADRLQGTAAMELADMIEVADHANQQLDAYMNQPDLDENDREAIDQIAKTTLTTWRERQQAVDQTKRDNQRQRQATQEHQGQDALLGKLGELMTQIRGGDNLTPADVAAALTPFFHGMLQAPPKKAKAARSKTKRATAR